MAFNPGLNDQSSLATLAEQQMQTSYLAPFTTILTSEVTFAAAGTDHLLPASEMSGRRAMIISNNSNIDIVVGSAGAINSASTPIKGVLIIAGGNMTLKAVPGLYAQCNVIGIKITITEFK